MNMRLKNALLLMLTLVLVAAWTISPIVGKDKVKVEGEGKLNLTNKTDFELKAENKTGNLKGNLEYKDKEADLKVKAKEVTMLIVDKANKTAEIHYNGTAKNDTVKFNATIWIKVWDNGKKGKPAPDRINITVMWDGSSYSKNETLKKGDIKVDP